MNKMMYNFMLNFKIITMTINTLGLIAPIIQPDFYLVSITVIYFLYKGNLYKYI